MSNNSIIHASDDIGNRETASLAIYPGFNQGTAERNFARIQQVRHKPRTGQKPSTVGTPFSGKKDPHFSLSSLFVHRSKQWQAARN